MHWAIKLANKNISVVAAYMILAQHVKDDLTRLDESKSLLTPKLDKFVQLQACNINKHGTYLYHDDNHFEFIRSGKVSTKGFGMRHEEHRKKAADESATENTFYMSYPTKNNVRAKSHLTRGEFESLTLYVAAGFESTGSLASQVVNNFDSGGIMIMNEADKTNINTSMKQTPDLLQKYHAFLSYLMELGYDLAIAPSCNVSGSFGFESFVGIFG
jgi:hypothetical protein